MIDKRNKKRIAGVILAAGKGQRMKTKIPKQYIKIGGKEIFIHTLQPFIKSNLFDPLIIVVDRKSISKVRKAISINFSKAKVEIVEGGNTRIESIKNALKFVKSQKVIPSHILFHDSARPLINESTIKKVIRNALAHGSAIAGIRGTDLSTSIKNGQITSIYNKSGTVLTQTPECFPFEFLLAAHSCPKPDIDLPHTTNLELVIARGGKVKFVELNHRNLKLTLPSDIDLIRTLL